MIVDHRVRLEDVASDLTAEADVGFRRIQLRLVRVAFFDLSLVQLVLEHLHCGRLVLELRPLRLRADYCTRRKVRDTHGGARLIHVLAAGSRGAINVDPQILVANLDVDLLVHDRVDEYRRKARMPPRIRIERRDSYETMHAGLRSQESIRVRSADLEHGALYPRFLALALVEDGYLETSSLRPTDVHPHEHLSPVLRFRSAGTGADLKLRKAKIVRPAQKGSHFKRLDVVVDARGFRVELALHFWLGSVLQQLVEFESAFYAAIQLVIWVEPIAQRLHFLERRLCFLLDIPEGGVGHLGVECAQASALAVDVKDTSAAPPVALGFASVRDRVRFPPFNRPPRPRRFSCRHPTLRSVLPESRWCSPPTAVPPAQYTLRSSFLSPHERAA